MHVVDLLGKIEEIKFNNKISVDNCLSFLNVTRRMNREINHIIIPFQNFVIRLSWQSKIGWNLMDVSFDTLCF